LEENLIGQSSNHQIFKSTNPQITQTYQVRRKPNLDKPEPNRKEFVILRDGNSNYRTQKKHCRRAELL
jgi:hypothetical protein